MEPNKQITKINGKKKTKAYLLLGLTIIAAIAALTIAWRIYQAGQRPIAPTAPESQPKAETEACTLDFSLPTPTPTPTGTQTPSTTPTPTPTGTQTPSTTPSATPAPSQTPIPTATEPTIVSAVSPTPALPQAGLVIPTISLGIIGLILLIFGTALII